MSNTIDLDDNSCDVRYIKYLDLHGCMMFIVLTNINNQDLHHEIHHEIHHDNHCDTKYYIIIMASKSTRDCKW